jgi:hypothetical protein
MPEADILGNIARRRAAERAGEIREYAREYLAVHALHNLQR